jgi:Ca2+-transporting ATPase
MEWYNKSKEEAITELGTDEFQGLSEQEAVLRLDKYGKNELAAQAKKSFAAKLLAQFADFLIIILIVAAIVSAAVGEVSDSIVILAIVVINALLGIYQ